MVSKGKRMLDSRPGRIAWVAALSLTAMGLAGFQAADIPDRHILIVNATSQTMTRFYAHDPCCSAWPEDILGGHVILAGASLRINVTDGSGQCVFNFQARFADGHTLEANRINVCENPEYRFTEEASR